MTIIKIDRSTIRKNQNFGNSARHFLGSVDITLDGEPIEVYDMPAFLESNKGRNISITNNFIDASCIDNGPAYYYDYENTPVACSECGHVIGYNDIPQGTIINEDGDEFQLNICPNCNEYDTFKYEFERLD